MTILPLTDLGKEHYLGHPGGLYPEGNNSPSPAYKSAGIAVSETVRPLDKDGSPAAAGAIGMLLIGMSNASREFVEFIHLSKGDSSVNPRLVFVDGAKEGAAATIIAIAAGSYWDYVERQLREKAITGAQVQVVWLKMALAYNSRPFPEDAQLLRRSLHATLGIVTSKFPQLKLVYVSSRAYGGYSKIDLSPEPAAYQSGFGVKWFIEDMIQSRGPNEPPWVSWGPYLWADGLDPRGDGLVWARADFDADGVHPSAKGAHKVARMLFDFLRQDETARSWFLSASK